MKNLINKLTVATSGAVLFVLGCVMAGLGFAVLGMLALFALATVGIALLASPFLAAKQPQTDDAEVVDVPETAVAV